MIKKRIKDIIILAVILTIVVLVAVYGIDIQSVDDYYKSQDDKITADTAVIYLSINAKTIYDNYEDLDPALQERYPIDGDGIILEKTTFAFIEGESVFDVLVKATKAKRIHLEFSHNPLFDSKYIEGINHLYEFYCGDLSGWMYLVNGIFPGYGADKYKLKEGDNIAFRYTCDLGRDIGGEFE